MLIEESISKYIRSFEGKSKTQSTYTTGLKHFIAFLEQVNYPIETTTTNSLTDETLADYFLWLRKRDLTQPSQRTYLNAARSYILELIADNLCKIDYVRSRRLLQRVLDEYTYPCEDPIESLPRVIIYAEELARNTEPLSKDTKYWEAVATLTTYRDTAIMHTLFSTAMRLSEMLNLHRLDVKDGKATEVTMIIGGKRGKKRTVVFTEIAKMAIGRYLSARDLFSGGYHADSNPYLFISHGRGPGATDSSRKKITKPLTPSRIWQIIKYYAKIVAETEKRPELLELHPHAFRHYRASQLLTDGMPAEQVRDVLGHSSITTTLDVYAKYLGKSTRDMQLSLTPNLEELNKRILNNDE